MESLLPVQDVSNLASKGPVSQSHAVSHRVICDAIYIGDAENRSVASRL